MPDIELPTGEHIPIEAQPFTGRTHQIRVHLAWGGHPVLGDPLYGSGTARGLALRAVELSYVNPFTRRKVMIQADTGEFLNTFWRE